MQFDIMVLNLSASNLEFFMHEFVKMLNLSASLDDV